MLLGRKEIVSILLLYVAKHTSCPGHNNLGEHGVSAGNGNKKDFLFLKFKKKSFGNEVD